MGPERGNGCAVTACLRATARSHESIARQAGDFLNLNSLLTTRDYYSATVVRQVAESYNRSSFFCFVFFVSHFFTQASRVHHISRHLISRLSHTIRLSRSSHISRSSHLAFFEIRYRFQYYPLSSIFGEISKSDIADC